MQVNGLVYILLPCHLQSLLFLELKQQIISVTLNGTNLNKKT